MNALDRTFLEPVTWPGLDFPDLLDQKAWGKSRQTPVTSSPLISQFTRHIETSYRSLQNFDINVKQFAGMKYGYAFISTTDNPAPQLEALRAFGYDKIVTDAGTDRPELLRCLKTLQAGDTLIVWKLDRLAGDIREIIDLSKDLQERGIALRSLTEKIDTSTPGGALALQYVAAGVEFHRNIIAQRGRKGLQAARKNGLKTGPARKLTPKQIAHMRELIAHNEPVQDVADLFNISRGTVYNYLKSPGSISIPPPRRPAKRKSARKTPKNE